MVSNRLMLIMVLIALIVSFSAVIAYSRSRLVNDKVSIDGRLSGSIRVGLLLTDQEGRRIYSASMTEERLLSFVISQAEVAVVEDPSKTNVYLVVNVTYSVSDMEYLKANITAVHYYEKELGLEPKEPELIQDIESSDGTHTAVLRVYLGTLDYFMWLDYYARKIVVDEYSYPFYPPAFYDEFDYEGEPNEVIWSYRGNVTVSDGKLYMGLTRYPSGEFESYVKTKRPYSLGSLSTTMLIHVYIPRKVIYASSFVGKPDWITGTMLVFRDWGFEVHVQKRWVKYSWGIYTFPWSKKVYWDEPGWHIINLTIRPTAGGSRVRVEQDGKFVCDVVWDSTYSPLGIRVYQHSGTACWAEVKYVAVGPSVSDKLLDWYVHVKLYGKGRDGKYYEASKDVYASFGSGEPRMDELAIRPVGVLYYSTEPSLLSLARVLSFVLSRAGLE